MPESDLFDTGIQIRREALGADYVDANLATSDEFMMVFQRAVTELAWGYAWSRPGLDRKTRFMINIRDAHRTGASGGADHLHEGRRCGRRDDRGDPGDLDPGDRLLRHSGGPSGVSRGA